MAGQLLNSGGVPIVKKVYFRWAQENLPTIDRPEETAELIIKNAIALDKLCMIHTKDRHTGKIIPVLCLRVDEDGGTKQALVPLARLFTKDYMKHLEPPQLRPKGQLDEPA
jgi:hypothetical protein